MQSAGLPAQAALRVHFFMHSRGATVPFFSAAG